MDTAEAGTTYASHATLYHAVEEKILKHHATGFLKRTSNDGTSLGRYSATPRDALAARLDTKPHLLPSPGPDLALPESDLLDAIHGYAAVLFDESHPSALRSLDESALLTIGLFVEELADEVIGNQGHLVLQATEKELKREAGIYDDDDDDDDDNHGNDLVGDDPSRSDLDTFVVVEDMATFKRAREFHVRDFSMDDKVEEQERDGALRAGRTRAQDQYGTDWTRSHPLNATVSREDTTTLSSSSPPPHRPIPSPGAASSLSGGHSAGTRQSTPTTPTLQGKGPSKPQTSGKKRRKTGF